ncbi:hypothetical protein SDC9_99598 [bioreactor metagenome]|uniref:Uncharacterized protein n=1 Tax=bioreactor metagenome TaxID=1076179 RepID=A0A645AI04_9ZZZZ
MGSGVEDAAGDAVVGQISVIRAGKCKLQHPHPRKARVCQQLYHIRGQKPQILLHKPKLGKPARKNAHQRHSRPRLPMPLLGGNSPGRDNPIACQRPEMVDSDGVEQLPGPLHPANPPSEAVGAHADPVVQRVAPKLAFGRKIVRRNPRHGGGAALFVQQKLLPLRPHVGGVQRHVNGQVAKNFYPQPIGK